MENASKAIGLSVGAILFMIAITISIVMYSNMIRTMNTTLSINNIKTNVIENKNSVIEDIKYAPSDIYYMVQGIKENFLNGKQSDIYVDSLYVNGTYIFYSDSDNIDVLNTKINTILATINPYEAYKVEYKYKYTNSELIDLNNHKIASIKWDEI